MMMKNYWLRGLQIGLLGVALTLAYFGVQRLLGGETAADYVWAMSKTVGGVILLIICSDFQLLKNGATWFQRLIRRLRPNRKY